MKKLGETGEFTFQVAADEVGERRNGGQERNRDRTRGTRERDETKRVPHADVETRAGVLKNEFKLNDACTETFAENYVRCAYTLCLTWPDALRLPLSAHLSSIPFFPPSSSSFFRHEKAKEKESRRAETRFYLILECAPQLDEFSLISRVSIPYFLLFQARARCLGGRVSRRGWN